MKLFSWVTTNATPRVGSYRYHSTLHGVLKKNFVVVIFGVWIFGLLQGRCRRNMVDSLPRGMPKVVDYRQTDAQATNKMVTQDRHEVLSRFGHRKA